MNEDGFNITFNIESLVLTKVTIVTWETVVDYFYLHSAIA